MLRGFPVAHTHTVWSLFSITIMIFSLGPVTSHKRDVQKKALHEYYEKHGGAPDH